MRYTYKLTDRYKKIDELSKTVTDGIGCNIDDGIRELVVLLNYNNIGTTMSCWGHTTHGLPYPWFDIDGDYYEHIEPFIMNLEISVENYDINTVRFYPTCETLTKGRKEFNKLKKKLKEASALK